MWLRSSLAERDLGTLVDSKLSMSQQSTAAAMKAKQILGFICRGIASTAGNGTIPLFSALVRMLLESYIQLWSPQFKKDVDRLERVQRNSTKNIKGLEKLLHEE